ncbi:MAG: TonB-dependent receptor [Blastocatellia bacterium]|nr:TonB-dependent receptor [Blastocatellia bacterium]
MTLVFARPYASPLNQTVGGLFIQDDYQVNRRLVLNIGLRYEIASVLNGPTHELTNYSFSRGLFTPGVDTDTDLYKGDHNNFAPRVGFAWSITGDGRTVLRGGYGIFYDAFVHTIGVDLNQNNPSKPYILVSLAPPIPGQLANKLDPSFLFDISGPSNAYDENLRLPYAQHFNLTFQREFGSSMVLSLGYVGSKGTKIVNARDINQALFIPGTDSNGVPLSNFFNTNSRRPSQLFNLTSQPVGSIRQFETGSSSSYHSFQTTFNKRMSRGLSVLGAYTWSKSIDNASDPFGFTGDSGAPQNSHDMRLERGLSVFDIRHQFTLGYTYELPFKGNRYIEGWEVNSTMSLKTGQPFTPVLGFDPTLTGSFAVRPHNFPGAFISKDGQLYLNPDLPKDPATGLPLAIIPKAGEFGTLGRNTFTGPGYKNVDLSVAKRTRLGERLGIETRFEMFNVFNRTNLALPERIMTDPLFGISSRTQDVAGGVTGIGGGGPRSIQLALRLVY